MIAVATALALHFFASSHGRAVSGVPFSSFAADLHVAENVDALPNEFAQEFSRTSPLRTPLNKQAKTIYMAGSTVERNAWEYEVAGGSAGAGPFGPSRPVLSGGIPIYVSSRAADVLVTVAPCTDFGGRCAVAGSHVHINPEVLVQSLPDQHLIVIDPQLGVEVDCWRALAKSGKQDTGQGDLRPDLSGNKLTCAWGGAYKLHTTGVRGSYRNQSAGTLGEGIHFGPAAGLMFVTPHELLRGHINHAIALNANCANEPMIYPANDLSRSDAVCSNGGVGPPHYGDAFELNWSASRIAASGHSKECKAVLSAMAVYGAYIADTGDVGTIWDVEGTEPYEGDAAEMGPNPWPLILQDLQAAGDADLDGNWKFCFDKLSASDFNLVELTPPPKR